MQLCSLCNYAETTVCFKCVRCRKLIDRMIFDADTMLIVTVILWVTCG